MTSETKRASLPASPFSDEPRQKRETPRLQPLATNRHRASQPLETAMTKQLTPLRRKDQATGYAKAVREIVAWLREEAVIYRSAWTESVDPRASAVADQIEAEFGVDNAT